MNSSSTDHLRLQNLLAVFAYRKTNKNPYVPFDVIFSFSKLVVFCYLSWLPVERRETMQVMDMLPKGDPRVENWPLMDSPVPTFAIVTFYLIFVLWLGPKLMARRSTGFNMRSLMLIYNLAMVLFSGWLWYEFCAAGWFGGGYTLGCQPVDRSRRPKAMRMAQVCWFFFISKLFELFDTACFVLRKKFDQVSFLHVFHHAVMPLSWWFGVKYVPGKMQSYDSP